jgi:hypothetical protein
VSICLLGVICLQASRIIMFCLPYSNVFHRGSFRPDKAGDGTKGIYVQLGAGGGGLTQAPSQSPKTPAVLS